MNEQMREKVSECVCKSVRVKEGMMKRTYMCMYIMYVLTHFLPVLVPAQFSSHDFHYPRQSLVCCLHIEEGQPRPTGQDINGSAGVFSDSILHLSLNVWELLGQL